MAYHIYAGDTVVTDAVLVGAGDLILVQQGALVLRETAGPIFASDPDSSVSILKIDGMVASTGGMAELISLDGVGLSLTVGSTGFLTSGAAGTQSMITLNGSLSSLTNLGTIAGRASSAMAVSMYGSQNVLQNTGQISNINTAVYLQNSSPVSHSLVVNEGSIVSVTANAIFSNGNMVVHNSGTIVSGEVNAINISAGRLTLVNTGTIVSKDGLNITAVYGDVFTDRVFNQGTITGNVNLYIGDDVYDGRGGVLNGDVLGGTGSDKFYVSTADISILEFDADLGTDHILSTVSFALNDYQSIEILSLIGTAQVATGNWNANMINGNHLANILSGLAGGDTLNGGSGGDAIYGGLGDDSALGGDDADAIDGGDGNDRLFGQDGDDALRGRMGLDRLEGGNDDDKLLGGIGNDTLTGDDGDDVLLGGAGADVLYGGKDADSFVFQSVRDSVLGASHDKIVDFVLGTDIIDLTAIDAKALTAGNDAFAFIGLAAFTPGTAGQLRYQMAGANLLLQGDVNGDAVADFEVQLTMVAAITATSLLL